MPDLYDMRCGAQRVLETIRVKTVRDPYNGDVYIYMSKNRKTVKLVHYENNSMADAKELLVSITALYAIEAEIRGKSHEEISERRQSVEVTDILTRYKAKLDVLNLELDSLPGIGQTAVSYALKLYPNMEKWREDPDYEIDNNFAERGARPVAMLRKTQNHVSSHKGAEASCILRSLIETYKLWKVPVCEYLNKIYTAFSVGRTDYDNLMPWCMPSFS